MTTKTYQPLPIEVNEGERYKWCTCGFSQAMPLCDHSHREKSTKKSFKFFAETTGTLYLCGCSETSTPPYCDQQQCKKMNNQS
ncbi:MAG: CDGSH iron-sulfur domain-containing protein [Gammaproteobacteria bacterium]|nr:CDGSH iron-sulfur domain-containing protein [Gammaproteobacteria bacterium]